MLRLFTKEDYRFASKLLPRLTHKYFDIYLNSQTGFIVEDNNLESVGILLYSFLWEKLPFVQHLIILESKRNQGYGSLALTDFENIMKKQGYKLVMLSTQVDEKAQFLYRKLGYIDCGSLFFENTNFDQPCELFLKKKLD